MGIKLGVGHVPDECVGAGRDEDLIWRSGGFYTGGGVDIGAMPTAFVKFWVAGVESDAQTEATFGCGDGSGGELLLDVYGAAHGLDGIFKSEEEGVAHSADFLTGVNMAAFAY